MKSIADRIVELRSDLQKWKTSQFLGSSSSFVYTLVRNGRYQFSPEGGHVTNAIVISFSSINQVAPMIGGQFRLYVNGVDKTNCLRILYPSGDVGRFGFLKTGSLDTNIWLEVVPEVWLPQAGDTCIFMYELQGTSQGAVSVAWREYTDVPL